MSIDPIIANWLLGIVGVVMVTGIAYIIKGLNGQTQALAVLVARTEPAINNVARTDAIANSMGTLAATVQQNVDAIKAINAELRDLDDTKGKTIELVGRADQNAAAISGLQADMSRVWGIYAAWTTSRNPMNNGRSQIERADVP